MLNISFMTTTKQNPMIDTQKRKRKEVKHTTTENNKITKEDTKE